MHMLVFLQQCVCTVYGKIRPCCHIVCTMLKTAFLLLICSIIARGSLFHDGDIVPTSRRAQFHGVGVRGLAYFIYSAQTNLRPSPQSRTTWHDVVGQFCPRFGMDRLVCDAELRYEVQNDWYVFPPTHTQTHQVAIPLPRPIGYETADEYKIMLSFDRTCGIRVHAIAWQRIMPTVG